MLGYYTPSDGRNPYTSDLIYVRHGRSKPKEAVTPWPEAEILAHRSDFCVPRKLILCVSNRCNCSCDMCTFRPGDMEPPLTLEEWEKLLEETSWANLKYTLFGGEPLMYEQIDELLDYMGKHQIHAEIVTNGYYLLDHYEALMENNIGIILSIDGREEFHDRIRHCPGCFDRIERALTKIHEEYPDKLQNSISVNSVILPDNVKEVEEFLDYLYGMGLHCVCFQHLQFYGEKEREETDQIWRQLYGMPFCRLLRPRRQCVYDQETLEAYKNFYKKIKEARDHYTDMEIYVHPELPLSEIPIYYTDRHPELAQSSSCLNPWVSAMVSADGKVEICLEGEIGNLREDGFWKIWYGQKAAAFRRGVAKGPFPVCTRCCNFYNSYIPE